MVEALLAVAAATSWFTKEQLDDIDTWCLEMALSSSDRIFLTPKVVAVDVEGLDPRLNEVADCGEAEDWMQHFPEDDLRDVVLDKLRRSDASSKCTKMYEVAA